MTTRNFFAATRLAALLALSVAAAATAFAQAGQQASPPAATAVSFGPKMISIRYSAPSVKGRKIFGPGGLLSKDPTYPVWRAGANDATAFNTDADLIIGNLPVPKGAYTLYCLVSDPDNWQLIISKEIGQWGLTYHPKEDLGRVKMTMSKPPAPVEKYRMTLTSTGPTSAQLEIAWENHVATVPITVK